MLIVGLASLVAGIILVLQPSKSLATLAVVVGIFFLIDGIVELVRSFGSAVENRGLAAIIGVLGVIVGIILIRHPTNAVAGDRAADRAMAGGGGCDSAGRRDRRGHPSA